MDEQTKRIACRMIAGLVASDEDFADTERHFLDKVLHQFGIPEDEWDAIFPLLEHNEAEAAIKTLEPMAQKETFDLLVAAAMADGFVTSEEREYLTVIGKAIGMDEAQLTGLIPATD